MAGPTLADFQASLRTRGAPETDVQDSDGNAFTDLPVGAAYGGVMQIGQGLRAAGALSETPWLEKGADAVEGWANQGPLRPPADTQSWAHPMRKLSWGIGSSAVPLAVGMGLGPVGGAAALALPSIGSGIEQARARLPNSSKEDQTAAGLTTGLFDTALMFTALNTPAKWIKGGNVGRSAFTGAINMGPLQAGGSVLGNEAILQASGAAPTSPVELAKQTAESSLFGGITGAAIGGGYARMHNRVVANAAFEAGREELKAQGHTDEQINKIKPSVVNAWAEKINYPEKLKKEMDRDIVRGAAGGDFLITSMKPNDKGNKVKSVDTIPYEFDQYDANIQSKSHELLRQGLDYVDENGSDIAVVKNLPKVVHQFLLNDIAAKVRDSGEDPSSTDQEILKSLQDFKSRKNIIFFDKAQHGELSLGVQAFHPEMSIREDGSTVTVPIADVVQRRYDENVAASKLGEPVLDMSDVEFVGTRSTEDAIDKLHRDANKMYLALVRKNPLPVPEKPVLGQETAQESMIPTVVEHGQVSPAFDPSVPVSGQIEPSTEQALLKELYIPPEQRQPDVVQPPVAQPGSGSLQEYLAGPQAPVAPQSAQDNAVRFFADPERTSNPFQPTVPGFSVKESGLAEKPTVLPNINPSGVDITTQQGSSYEQDQHQKDWNDPHDITIDEKTGQIQIKRNYIGAEPKARGDFWKGKSTERTVEAEIFKALGQKVSLATTATDANDMIEAVLEGMDTGVVAEIQAAIDQVYAESYKADPTEDVLDDGREYSDSILTAMGQAKSAETQDALEGFMQDKQATGEITTALGDLKKQFNDAVRMMKGISKMLVQDKMIVSPIDTRAEWTVPKSKTLEVSSAGDKRFSALYATFKSGAYAGRTIEDVYQNTLKMSGKGRAPAKESPLHRERASDETLEQYKKRVEEVSFKAYKQLWSDWLVENPELANELSFLVQQGVKLTDKFAGTAVNQARALTELVSRKPGKASQIVVRQALEAIQKEYSERVADIRKQLEAMNEWEGSFRKVSDAAAVINLRKQIEGQASVSLGMHSVDTPSDLTFTHWTKQTPPLGVTFVEPVVVEGLDIDPANKTFGQKIKVTLSGPLQYHEFSSSDGQMTHAEITDGDKIRIVLNDWRRLLREDAYRVNDEGLRPRISLSENINIAHGGQSIGVKQVKLQEAGLLPLPTAKESTGTIEQDRAEKAFNTTAGSLDVKEFEGRIRSISMKLGYWLAKKMGSTDRFLAASEAWMGKDKFNDVFGKTKIIDPTNELIQTVINNKRLTTSARFMADQTGRVANDVYEDVARNLLPQGKPKEIASLMGTLKAIGARALEEFGIDENGKMYLTIVGTRRGHGLTDNYYPPGEGAKPGEEIYKRNQSDAARQAHVNDMMKLYKELGRVPTQEEIASWNDHREELAFFNLLKETAGSDRLNRLLAWWQGEVINPYFKEMIDAGAMTHQDVVSAKRHGYSPRRWGMVGDQLAPGSSQSSDHLSRSTGVQKADYDTYSEYYFATQGHEAEISGKPSGKGMYVLDDMVEAGKEYMIDSMMKTNQYHLINRIKSMVMPTDGLFLKNFNGNDPLHQLVRDRIKMLRWVEYASKKTHFKKGDEEWQMSENISELRKLTGMDPMQILQELGYIQAKNREGLVAWDGVGFQPPFLQKGIEDLLEYIYPTHSTRLAGAAKILNIPKRVLSIVPWDSISLFAGGIIANTSPWDMPGLMVRYAKETALSFRTGAKTLAAMKRGEGYDVGRIELPNMDEYIKAVQMGFPESFATMVSGYLEDNKALRWTSAIEQTPEQAFNNVLESTANTNKHMFERFVLKELWNVTQKKRDQFYQRDPQAGKDVALRRAVEYIAKASFMTPSHEFGPSGQVYNIAMFSRGLTFGPLALVAGAMGIGGKVKKGFASTAINPITNAFTDAHDVRFLQREYLNHIAKMAAIKIAAIGTVQYMLSFLDDKDEPDEKKRFFWNNPSGLTLATRLPFRDINGNELYSKPQFAREVNQWVDLAGWGSLPFPTSVHAWLKNRANAGVSMLMSALENYDMSAQKKIADPKLPPEEYWSEMAAWMMKNATPFSLGLSDQEKAAKTGDDFIDAGLTGINAFGANITSGPKDFFRTEPGMPTWKQLKSNEASEALKNEKMKQFLKVTNKGEYEPQTAQEARAMRSAMKGMTDARKQKTYNSMLKKFYRKESD